MFVRDKISGICAGSLTLATSDFYNLEIKFFTNKNL